MSGVSRKRGLGDDYPPAVDNDAKVRREDGQLLRVTEPFVCIDDVTLELRSIEGQVKSDALRQILERLDKSDSLVRRKQGQDVAPEPDRRIIYMDEIAELRRLIDDLTPTKGSRAQYEELLAKIGSDDRIVGRQANSRPNSNHMLENVAQNDSTERPEPFQQEHHPLQAIEQSAANVKEEVQIVESNPDVQNLRACVSGLVVSSAVAVEPVKVVEQFAATVKEELQEFNSEPDVQILYASGQGLRESASTAVAEKSLVTVEQLAATIKEDVQEVESSTNMQDLCAGGDSFMMSAAVTDEPLMFSNKLKNVAQINFNETFMQRLGMYLRKEGNPIPVEELLNMMNRRMSVIRNPQYMYNLLDQQQFNQELATKLRWLSPPVSIKRKIQPETLINMLQLNSLDHYQLMCPFVEYLPDIDLLNCIASYSSDIAAAQLILRARKLSLKRLSFEPVSVSVSQGIFVLKLDDSTLTQHSAAGIQGKHRKFEYELGNNTVDAFYAFRLFHIIMQFYDVSKASISLINHESNRRFFYHLLETTFGAPQLLVLRKIRIKELIIESPEMIDFLRWFCPTKLVIGCDPGGLNTSEPALVAGVDMIQCRSKNVDGVLENCIARLISINGTDTWSDASAVRFLTAYRLSANTGCRREITHQVQQTGTGTKSVNGWRKLFELWTLAFEADYGMIGRKITLSDNGVDVVTLTLH